jgi:hypothetical protein
MRRSRAPTERPPARWDARRRCRLTRWNRLPGARPDARRSRPCCRGPWAGFPCADRPCAMLSVSPDSRGHGHRRQTRPPSPHRRPNGGGFTRADAPFAVRSVRAPMNRPSSRGHNPPLRCRDGDGRGGFGPHRQREIRCSDPRRCPRPAATAINPPSARDQRKGPPTPPANRRGRTDRAGCTRSGRRSGRTTLH